jgi:hypothetical protein
VKWLKIFDASGSWPTDPAACWADGFRVIAGYAGSQSWKTFTPAMLAKWVTPAYPFGIAAMYESKGDEALQPDSAAIGTQHAHAARQAWRALGMPDAATIAYAVDLDVSMAQVRGPIAAYFRAIAAADTCKPISYLENDGSEWLAIKGITAGGFLPAAFAWGNPPVLATPSNAPPHALWLQEHNGVPLHGGDVDTGHIRDDAPIWWNGAKDMAGFDAADAKFLLTYKGLPSAVPVESLGTAVMAAQSSSKSADAKLDTVLAKLGTTPPAGAPVPISDADVQRIAAATADLLYERLKG